MTGVQTCALPISIAQLAEAADLKSAKCRFESDWGHRKVEVDNRLGVSARTREPNLGHLTHTSHAHGSRHGSGGGACGAGVAGGGCTSGGAAGDESTAEGSAVGGGASEVYGTSG